jgi:murein DD-endopeptidase MepM/ murein hydrolase activator NlpD
MTAKRQKRKQIKKKLFTKNRLVILNEDTFEEIFSLRLTLMNVFVVFSLGALLLISLTTYIIAFTPLREYIPGYASTELKRNATALALKSDSIATALHHNDRYLESVKKALLGQVDVMRFNRDSILKTDPKIAVEIIGTPNDTDLNLRAEIEREDKYNVFEKAQNKTSIVFFSPVKGMVTERFNAKSRHFAIDVALPRDTPIKSVVNGTVIFADWTPSTGYVIIIRHNEGFISAYKHAASLTKSQGDVVRSGEVIALAGSTGNQSTGIHLHFELWKDGHPIDPENFISFE